MPDITPGKAQGHCSRAQYLDRYKIMVSRGFPSMTRRRIESLAPFTAPALILLSSTVPWLISREVGLWRVESLIIIAGTVLAGVSAGAIMRLRPQTLTPALLLALLAAFLVKNGFIDTLSDAVVVTGKAASGLGIVLPVAPTFFSIGALCMLLLSLIVWSLRAKIAVVVTVGFGAFLMTSVMVPPRTHTMSTEAVGVEEDLKDLPLYIHIILDEHIGLRGLSNASREHARVVDVLRATYADFTLYERAYSRFAETRFSLASQLNGEITDEIGRFLEKTEDGYGLRHNELFRSLGEQGYKLKVYQSSYFDLCTGNVPADACHTYSASSLEPLFRADLTTFQRVRFLTEILLGLREGVFPLSAVESFQAFKLDVSRTRKGVAYIVHLLVPHFPYVLRDDCALATSQEWQTHGAGHLQVMNTPEERSGRYGPYLSQLVCTANLMSGLVRELKALGVYDDATIIVHGDHGSRIGERSFRDIAPDRLTDDDVLDHFSTLLAIKAPGTRPGTIWDPISVQDAFSRILLGRDAAGNAANDTVWILHGDSRFEHRAIRWPNNPTLTELRPVGDGAH